MRSRFRFVSTDEQLDRAASVSLNGGAPLTAQFLIEVHALRHSWHHLTKMKAVRQGGLNPTLGGLYLSGKTLSGSMAIRRMSRGTAVICEGV